MKTYAIKCYHNFDSLLNSIFSLFCIHKFLTKRLFRGTSIIDPIYVLDIRREKIILPSCRNEL